MIKDLRVGIRSQSTLLLFQGVGVVLLTLLLTLIFSQGQGLLFMGAILAGIGALWLMRSPQWGVLIILALWFLDILALSRFRIPYLVTGVLLIPLALSILRDREIWVLRVPQIKILLAIGFLLLISTWWNDFRYPTTFLPQDDETQRQLQIFFARLAFLIFLLYFITTPPRIKLVACVLVGLVVFTVMSALFPALTGGAAQRLSAAFSLAKNANRLAYISLFATSLLWFYRSHGLNPRWKVPTLPLLFLLPLAALAAGSRSGFLQLLVLAAMILYEQKSWSMAKKVRGVLALAALGLLLLMFVPSTLLERMTTYDPTIDAPGQESLRHRIDRIHAALAMIASDPVLGTGIGNFKWIGRSFYGPVGEAHNSYLWAFSAGGIGVLALYLLMFYVTYRMLRQLERAGPPDLLWLSKGLKVSLMLFLIFSAFADFWLSEFLYVIVGLTIAMAYHLPTQDQRPALMRAGSSPARV